MEASAIVCGTQYPPWSFSKYAGDAKVHGIKRIELRVQEQFLEDFPKKAEELNSLMREMGEQSWASGKPNPGLPWVGIRTYSKVPKVFRQGLYVGATK